jgi:CPA2 family monovalent cation:H+ antiporter-2
MTHMLAELVLVFALSVGVILVCHRFKVPTIVGFLLTGVAAGPSCLGLVGAVEEVEHLSEVGVVLLMFSIGLELSGGELARLRKQIMLGGGVQVGATVALFAGAALLGGQSPGAAVFLGLLACLSSTAIVLKLYQARAELEAPHGRVTLSILILQDILVAPMVLAVPMLAGSGGSGLSSVLPLVKGVALWFPSCFRPWCAPAAGSCSWSASWPWGSWPLWPPTSWGFRSPWGPSWPGSSWPNPSTA